ncbi:MAG: DUF2169 domain-containing protein [Polyangiaceae bacterium]
MGADEHRDRAAPFFGGSPAASVTLVEEGGGAVAARGWRVGDRHFVTVVVKSEVYWGGLGPTYGPAPIVANDRWAPDGTCLEDASDLAVYLGRGEVLFFGSIYGSGNAQGALSIVGPLPERRVLLDKRVAATLPAGTSSVPIDHRAPRGGDLRSGRAEAVLWPSALGPIAPTWPWRGNLLRVGDAERLREAPAHLTQGFDFRWFHAAPHDQRIDGMFSGRETIVLRGLSARGTLELPLPSLRAEVARVEADGSRTVVPVALDLVRVFGDEPRVTLTWRGNVPRTRPDEPLVFAAKVLGDGAPSPHYAGRFDLDETRLASWEVFNAMTLPFAEPLPEPHVRAAGPVPGAPWASPLAPVAGAAGVDETVLAHLDVSLLHVSVAPTPIAEVRRAPDAPLSTVKLRDTPGSRYLVLALSALRRR